MKSTQEYAFGVLIKPNSLKKFWKVNPSGILHVGAHDAEERDAYVQAGWRGPIFWVEALDEKVEALRVKLPVSDSVIQAAVWSRSGIKKNLKITNNSQSSSLFDLGKHKRIYPDIFVVEERVVETRRLDEILPDDFFPELIALDIQGAELEALKGFGDRVQKAKWIYSEVNREKLYVDCCLVSELDIYLEGLLFKRVSTRWIVNAGWGDALWVRKDVLPSIFASYPLHRFFELIFFEYQQRVRLVRRWLFSVVRKIIA